MIMQHAERPALAGSGRPSLFRHLDDALARTAQALFDIVRRWQGRQRQRRALADLDARLLADIGVSADDAAREAAKPFWR